MKSEKSVKTAYNEILSYYSCDLGMGEGSRRILSGGGNFPIATGRTSKGKQEDFGSGCQQLMQNKTVERNHRTALLCRKLC